MCLRREVDHGGCAAVKQDHEDVLTHHVGDTVLNTVVQSHCYKSTERDVLVRLHQKQRRL